MTNVEESVSNFCLQFHTCRRKVNNLVDLTVDIFYSSIKRIVIFFWKQLVSKDRVLVL